MECNRDRRRTASACEVGLLGIAAGGILVPLGRHPSPAEGEMWVGLAEDDGSSEPEANTTVFQELIVQARRPSRHIVFRGDYP